MTDNTAEVPRGARPELGLIEGFYGRPWSADQRTGMIRFLDDHGFAFYLYAPKPDPYLRRRWREDHPPDRTEALAALARTCRDHGIRFGVGLSPYEVFVDFDAGARDALDRKLRFLDDLGIDDLALLFDDMRGDLPDLARRQLEVVDHVAARTHADRLIVCPTYYSDDPVLDQVFGQRPEGYLEALGAGLDAGIEVFWTGPEVIAREISQGHVHRVAETLGRPPFLWDNYPVNDGPRLCRYLHVRGFTGRPAALADRLAAHAVNGALQPVLTRVPLLTLLESYDRGADYDYVQALHRAARRVLGPTFGPRLAEDVLTLQDVGLERLEDREARLRERYGSEDHPAAREIMAWLDGEYGVTREQLEAW
jgi:hypothetical protein